MKISKTITAGFVFLLLSLFSLFSYSQDNRTLETRVADLLARLPARDIQLTDKLMDDMLNLGEPGWKLICDQIIPAGTGDDTRPRFAIESFSRYLSRTDKAEGRGQWENNCIAYAVDQENFGVKDFFMKQLQLIGGEASIEAMKNFLTSKEMCEPALAVISAIGGKSAEKVLAESLKDKNLPCAAAVMNDLALMKSGLAVNEYIEWASDNNVNIRSSALNALAQSGSPLAYPVLRKAARDVAYRWEVTGATSSLLNYAREIASRGDIKTMDKICKLVISKSKDKVNVQGKTDALEIYVSFHGISAMPYIIRAASDGNMKYRTAAMKMSLAISGPEVVQKWVAYFPKAIPAAKSEIITMLGSRGDELALPLVNSSLSDPDPAVRKEAAEAIVKISGDKSINSLINYMLVSGSKGDQKAAKSALETVLDNDDMHYLLPVLREGQPFAKKTAIELIAWKKDTSYFKEILPYTVSGNGPGQIGCHESTCISCRSL